MIAEDVHDVGDGGSLLADSEAHAEESLGVVEGGLQVDDGIDGNGSLSSLSVTNDQLSLASTIKVIIDETH